MVPVLSTVRLVVNTGSGQYKKQLKEMAGSHINFILILLIILLTCTGTYNYKVSTSTCICTYSMSAIERIMLINYNTHV